MQTPKRIITIGTSMGGLKALKELVKNLPNNLPIAVLIVQHISENGKHQLPGLLSKITPYKVKIAEENEPIIAGYIYISRSDKHMIVEDNKIVLGEGIRINGSRPSIDALFKSVAVSYKENTIGIVLTGLLYDGGKGLKTIKEANGVTVVQNPEEAEYKDMPVNAIRNAEIDYVSNLEDMGPLIRVLVNKETINKKIKFSQSLIQEIKLFARKSEDEKNNTVLGEYGNSNFSEHDSLLTILQIMQERTNMYENMAEANYLKGNKNMALTYFRRSAESKLHTENLKKHLEKILPVAS